MNSAKLKPGVVYILNHHSFTAQMAPHGNAVDVKNLENAFEKCAYEINRFDEPTENEVTAIGQLIKQRDFSEHSAVVVVILSSGGTNETILAHNDQMYDITDKLVLPMQQNATLQCKPKLLFIEASRGAHLENCVHEYHSSGTADGVWKCYSTIEGRASFRHKKHGSYFMRELCQLFVKHGVNRDIFALTAAVKNGVLKRTNGRQVPSYTYSQP